MVYGISDVSASKVAEDLGVASSGTNNTLTDPVKRWQVNHWFPGFALEIFKILSGITYIGMILSNTATQITFTALPAGVTVQQGDLYYIRKVGSLTVISQYTRWGRNVAPAWVHAAEVVAPGAGTVLVTQAVTAGLNGYIYGFFISTQEANNFLLNWVSATVAYAKRIVYGAAGAVEAVDGVAINEGLPADAGSNITITNVNAAGAGMIYQANLLYAEV
jgi:hypothetical protein